MPPKDSRCDTCRRSELQTGYSDCDECPRCIIKRKWCLGVAKEREKYYYKRNVTVCSTVGCQVTFGLEEDRDDTGVYYCESCWEIWELDQASQPLKLEQTHFQSNLADFDQVINPKAVIKLDLISAETAEKEEIDISRDDGCFSKELCLPEEEEMSPLSSSADISSSARLFCKTEMVWEFTQPSKC